MNNENSGKTKINGNSIVSFRSECEIDWGQLEEQLKFEGIEYSLGKHKMSGTDFELHLRGTTIDDIFDCMCKVVDGHVMCDTIRPVPLIENPLTRRYNGQTKPRDWMAEEETSLDTAALLACIQRNMSRMH